MSKNKESNDTDAAKLQAVDEAAAALFEAAARLVARRADWRDDEIAALALRALARQHRVGGFAVRVEVQRGVMREGEPMESYHPLNGERLPVPLGPYLALAWDEAGYPYRRAAPLAPEDAAKGPSHIVEVAKGERESASEALWDDLRKLALVEALAETDPAALAVEWPNLYRVTAEVKP